MVQVLLWRHIVNKNFTGSKVLKVFMIFLFYTLGNTLGAMGGYYIHGNVVDRYFLLMAQGGVILFLLLLVFLCRKADKIDLGCEWRIQEIVWLTAFLGLFLVLLCSTDFSFMPVWGNVDEAVHIEVSAQFRNILDGGKNPLFRHLSDVQYALARYSYCWSYHYNCALISKIFNVDVLYFNHLMKCFSLSLFVTTPMLWVKGKKSILIPGIILYFCVMVIFVDNWYVYFHSGYSPQIFSLGMAGLVITLVLRVEDRNNRIINRILIPAGVLFIICSYMLTGVVVLLFAITRCLRLRDIKGIGMHLLWCLYIIPLPPIWNQLLFFLFGKGSADEALTAGSQLLVPPSVTWIIVEFIGIIVVLISRDFRKHSWMAYANCWFISYIAIYFLGDNTGYVMYKIMISCFPFVVLLVCDIVLTLFGYLKWKDMPRTVGMILTVGTGMFILALTGVAHFSMDSLKGLVMASPQISRGEYECMKQISVFDEETFDGIEYVGMNGPSCRVGFVYLRKIPFSWTAEGTGWSFKSNFYVNGILEGYTERVLRGETPEAIYVIINEEKAEDLEKLSEYSLLLRENKEVFRWGNCSLRYLSFEQKIGVERLDYAALLEYDDFVEKSIHNYGECALVGELDREITYIGRLTGLREVDMVNIKGRSIHNSKFIVRLYNKGQLTYETDISGFEKEKLIKLKEKTMCDSYEICVEGKNFSDSIIITDIDFYGQQ